MSDEEYVTCLWKDCYKSARFGSGTTAITWDEKHSCSKCSGADPNCKQYVPLIGVDDI